VIVGLSISVSPDLAARGFGLVHLQDAMVEFARYLFARGDRVAYGGPFQTNGFALILIDLVRDHGQSLTTPCERIASYLAASVWAELDPARRALLVDAARIIDVPPPPDLGLDLARPEDRRRLLADPYLMARCRTAMRERMTRDVDARIILGGKVEGFKGLNPGIAEEAYLTMASGKPLFLLGAFGGAAQAVIDAVRGGAPRALTRAFRGALPGHDALAAAYAAHGRQEEVERDLAGFFAERGVAGLRNGLSDAENEELFTTDDIPAMVSLVLRGLGALRR
jgi:hypothetical protein